MAQVKRPAAAGTLRPKEVVVPGVVVDAIVVDAEQRQTYLDDYSPYYAGQLRAPAEALVPQAAQFDFYDGCGLDVAFLSFAEVDREGNVNVTRFGGRLNGPGGFINISQHSRHVVFCGTLAAGGLDVRVGAGRLGIAGDGRFPKLVERVQVVSFNGRYARSKGQRVTIVTERAVFRQEADGLHLIEVAPGVDVQRDIVARMAVVPLGVDTAQVMDEGIFR